MTSHDDDSLAAFLEEPACQILNKGVLIMHWKQVENNRWILRYHY